MTTNLETQLKNKINNKTKPLGSLGKLEDIAFKIGKIQGSVSPKLRNPAIVVFGGDHGITDEGVSAYPQAVTAQMVLNFFHGGAGINVFTRQNGLDLVVVDAGVNFDFSKTNTKERNLRFINAKIAKSTKNFLKEPSMSEKQLQQAISKGSEIIDDLAKRGTNIIGFGEIGIGNTSSSAILMHKITHIPMEECVGHGTGIDEEGRQKKIQILKKACHKYSVTDPLEIMKTFGGFELAMMMGAFLEAKEKGMTILVGGYIVTAVLLVASAINSKVLDNCIFVHEAAENGHKKMLEFLDAEPVLDLGLRLGEGTGSALAYPIIESAVNFLNEMQSFDGAKVSKKNG